MPDRPPPPTPIHDPAYTLDDFARFVHNARFRFAKTMAHIPHHYTVCTWNDDTAFRKAAGFIADHGYKRMWGRREFTYLEHNGFKYWHMGHVINREKLPEAKP